MAAIKRLVDASNERCNPSYGQVADDLIAKAKRRKDFTHATLGDRPCIQGITGAPTHRGTKMVKSASVGVPVVSLI